MDALGQLPSKISVQLPSDEEGFTGRECPKSACEGYFKIVLGTGLEGEGLPCHCPYCGYTGRHDEFYTKEQIEFAKSVALRQVVDALREDLKSLEFDRKPEGPFGIGISLNVQSGPAIPIFRYREKELETDVVCGHCTLRYSVYGVFGYCPDCGEHNSLQIFEKNLDVVRKMLDLAGNVDREIAAKLVENALEDCVSAFDGFGREFCRVYRHRASAPEKAVKIRFQDLENARVRVQSCFGFALEKPLDADTWIQAIKLFQKRHLIAHKMGVVDREYIRRTGDSAAIEGHKTALLDGEIRQLIHIVSEIAKAMLEEVERLDGEP